MSTPERTCYGVARSCQTLFKSYVAMPLICNHDIAAEQQARFNIWAANIGVFADLRSSLDYCLKENNEVRMMVLQLLDLIHRNLRRAIDAQDSGDAIPDEVIMLHPRSKTLLGRFGRKRRKESAQAEPSSVEIAEQVMLVIRETIDRLQRLHSAIRQFSAQNRYLKAATFTVKDEDGEDSSRFRELANLMVRRQYPYTNDVLREQLGLSIFVRRNAFLYSSRHQRKLARERTEAIVSPDRDSSSSLGSKVVSSTAVPKAKPTKSAALSGTTVPILPRGGLNPNIFQRLVGNPQPSVASSGTSIIVQDNEQLYPPPPNFEEGKNECVCPYCFDNLKKSMTEGNRWRRHVDEDLEPYVCVFPECRGSLEYFVKFEEWLAHTNSHAVEWHCDAATHSPVVFRTKQDFIHHLETIHAGTFTDSQLPVLADLGARQGSRPFTTCPLCNCLPENIEAEMENIGDKALDLLPKHIAGHLKILAFISLPWRDDVDDYAQSGSKKSSDFSHHTSMGRKDIEQESTDMPSLSLSFDETPTRRADDKSTTIPEAEWGFITKFALQPPKDTLRPPTRISAELSASLSITSSRGSSPYVYWLKEQLKAARLECPLRPFSFFVPIDVQENLVTEAIVGKDINAHDAAIPEDEANKYARTACQVARHLYATLAYTRRGGDICALLNEGITDEDLPFKRKDEFGYELFLKNGYPVQALKAWSSTHLATLDRIQWWMISPVFFPWEHYLLDPKIVLPFVPLGANSGTLLRKRGAYSEVYPVRIHPAHHRFWKTPSGSGQDEEPLVAVKELFSSDETEFLKERTILCALGPKNHPHLIKLLATYEINKKYHLMFLYANANLRNYWEDHPTPKFDNETVYWSIKQMTGIASALQLIHTYRVTVPLSAPGAGHADVRYSRRGRIAQLSVENGEQSFGRHGDIKPENVLWFDRDSPMGVLQIADFGLGRLHGRDSPLGLNQETVLMAPTYEAPVYSLRLPASRAYDIWSLGCIYLEFITWLLKGSAAIDAFAEYRGRLNTDAGVDDDNFFTIITEDGLLKAHTREEVIAWVCELHAHKNCSALIHDILDLIMAELLVVEADHRTKASGLYVQLKKILEIAETDTEYLLKPVPRQPPSGGSNPKPPLEPPKRNAKRDSVTFLDQEHPQSSNTQFKVPSMENPRDLVLRNLGTPNFKPKDVGMNPTWPLPRRETHASSSTERAQPPSA